MDVWFCPVCGHWAFCGHDVVGFFLLSRTVLKGMPSAFVLELPPFRRPQIGQVLVRSLLDRTIFVLGRAITAAAPAGAVIWLLQRIQIGMAHC